MYDVQLVIPTYNESACIEKVLSDWEQTLDVLQINYRIIVINDGSRDKTESILLRYNGNPKYLIINNRNSGHGPTILHGYRTAANDSCWVFQVDSDNEIAAQHFEVFWSKRNDCDACIGTRSQRQQPLSRKAVSIAAFLIIRFLYGKGIQDVN